MIDTSDVYLFKAQESLTGAESEMANERYNNCANRSYYACFQAAIAALRRAGIQPSGTRSQWSHAFVQAQFTGQLINRRKLYPVELRPILLQTLALRQNADYSESLLSRNEANRVLRWSHLFVETVQEGSRPQ